MDDVYENINDYDLSRKRKNLIVFDDMIAEIMTNKQFQAIIKELFIRCRKLYISLVFITQSYFSVPKHVRLNSSDYLIMKFVLLLWNSSNTTIEIEYFEIRRNKYIHLFVLRFLRFYGNAPLKYCFEFLYQENTYFSLYYLVVKKSIFSFYKSN